jgi:hypothetical protein
MAAQAIRRYVISHPLGGDNSPIRVRLYGNTAVARLHEAFEVVGGPDRVKHLGWTTDLLERRQGRWQIVWSQTTPTPNNQALLIQALKAA